MTYDEMIASGNWGTGGILALRQRMAEYTVDGKRLGGITWKTESGSPHDSKLDKSDGETLAGALALAHLGFEHVEITAHDQAGKDLEKPDLDAIIDGNLIGVEIAEVPGAAKQNSLKNRIEVAVVDRLSNDPDFRQAFGTHFLSVNLNPIGRFQHQPIEGKREAGNLLKDLQAFISDGLTVPAEGRHLVPFPPKYEALNKRGAEYHIAEMESGPYFTLGDGPGFGPGLDDHRVSDVIAVLDKHRASARINYRRLPEIWMVLFLPDADELFRHTVQAAAKLQIEIEPFAKCFLVDTAGVVKEIGPNIN